MSSFSRLGILTVVCCLAVSVAAAGAEPDGAGAPRRYLTKAGEPLPFASEDELLRFMATAGEMESESLPTGVTKPKRLVLERDRVRLRAVFHHVDEVRQESKRLPNGRMVQYFRDSYRNQAAAYAVARLLGLRNVPPTVLRTSGGRKGSAQLWIENAMVEADRRERGLEHPDPERYARQYFEMRVFDNIINNIDRNQTNILFDADWNLWMIDHTRTFGRDKSLPFPEMVRRCSRDLWQALRDLDPKRVRAALKPYLGDFEISAVVARARKVEKLLDKRIAELGEARVLFSRGAALGEAAAEDVVPLPAGSTEG